jgi:hypothetical protein
VIGTLAVPLSADQIRAANRLYDQHLKQWQLADRALETLHKRVPGFDAEACLLKVATLNTLYSTNVYAVVRMAEHVRSEMAKPGAKAVGPELVERLAALPPTEEQEGRRRHHVFASKFAHFFIDAERFPLLDSFVLKMLKHHLGKRKYVGDAERPYVRFVAYFDILKRLSDLAIRNRELDRYLWLAGQYREWLTNPKVLIGSEVRKLFKGAAGDTAAQLQQLLR